MTLRPYEPELTFLLYRSRIHHRGLDLADLDIMRAALRNNLALDITGFLCRLEQCYCQYIEGPRASVAKLYQRILTDHRHYDVQILAEGQSPYRRFDQFGMGYGDCRTEASLRSFAEGTSAETIIALMQEAAARHRPRQAPSSGYQGDEHRLTG